MQIPGTLMQPGGPQCPHTEPIPPHPSALDRTGVAFLYNLPRPLLGGALAPSDTSTLVWHRPNRGEFVVWKSSGATGQAIEFDETTGCYAADCSAGDSPWWKPVLYRNDTSVDVLMYGPGGMDEAQFANLDGAMIASEPGIFLSTIAVPVLLDRVFSNVDRSIWWIRPNYPYDSL